MRKILYIAGVLLCAGMVYRAPIALAQEEKVPAQEADQVRLFTGTIDVVLPADPANKTFALIKVMDEKGTRLIFIVKPGTPIMGKQGKLISLGRVKKGDRVVLEYLVDVKKKRVVKSIVVTE